MVTNNNEKMQELTVEEKLQNLYELQRIDTEIDKIKTLRGELPLEVQDLEDEIAGLETRIENLKVELGELDKTSSTRKMDIKKAEEAIKKYSEQLDNVRNNREYDALSKEIEFQKLEIELQEKRIREAQKAKAEKEALMEESKKRYEDKVSDLEAKKGELDTVLYNLCESIRIVATLINPIMNATAVKIYDQLGITDENLKTWESVKTFGLIGENTKVHKGEALFPRLDIEKEVEELNELFSKKKDEPKEELIEHKENITIDDLDKVELRVGKILSCEKHPKADRLLVSQVKVGPETRQIVSGIAKWYKPEEMVGKDVIVVCNLKPVKLRGVESQGMILAAGNDGDDLIVPVATGANSGCEVR